MKKYRSLFYVAAVIGILLYVIGRQSHMIRTLQVNTPTQEYCDSLKAEISVMEIQIGRYEVILDRLDEELSPECKTKVSEIEKNVE